MPLLLVRNTPPLTDHTHARARLAPQISKLRGGWDLARSRVFSQTPPGYGNESLASNKSDC